MANEAWVTAKIESLIEDGTILAHKDGNYGSSYPRVHEFGEEGVPFLTAKLLTDSGQIDLEAAPRLAEEKANKLTYGFIEAGDVLLSHNATVGRVAVVPALCERVLVGTSLTYYRVDPERLLPRYLAAFFKGRGFQNQLRAVMSHSTRNQVPITAQRQLTVVVPPLPEQRRIAHILGTLADKIELNRRMNETLEAMAQALFKSWFVDFDPVFDNALAAGYLIPAAFAARAAQRAAVRGQYPPLPDHLLALFPDRFQDSPLGPIPEGWEAGCIGDIGENPRRGIKPEAIPEGTPYIGLEHVPRGSIALGEWGDSSTIGSGKNVFNQGEILFGKLRPYFHKVGVPIVDGVCSTDILVLVPRVEHWFGLLLGHASSVPLVAAVSAAASGTKMPRTKWKDLAGYPIAVPPAELAEHLNQHIRPSLQQIRQDIHESRALADLRDTLLPQLLGGECSRPGCPPRRS